jgi:hypothetical protein
MKKHLLFIILILWIIISLFIRTYGLERSPLSIGFDEAALGYNAYSLDLTGKDEYGTSFPLSLRSFNDFKPALYAYFVVPFVHFLGLNQTTTRLPSAIFGTISLIFLFLIFKKVSGKTAFTCLAALIIISFLPWRIHFSRVAFEANISMAFFTGTVWCLINYKEKFLYKLGTVFFAVLSVYSYHSSRLAIPVLLFLSFFDSVSFKIRYLFENPLECVKKLLPTIIVLLCYLPLFLEFNPSLILTRFGQTNIFNHYYPFTPRELISTKNVWLNPINNPIYYLGGMISGHILAYVSPQNLSLLIYQGVVKSAQAISQSGMLGFLGGLLFVIGFVDNVGKFIYDKNKRTIIYWILAGIIPAAITWEWFYPLRSLNIYPAIDIFVGLGLLKVFEKISNLQFRPLKYVFYFITSFTIIVNIFYVIFNEYNYGAWETSGEFQPGGFREGASLLMTFKDKYKVVYIDSNQGQSYEIFWFYMKYPPSNIQRLAYKRNIPGVEGPSGFDFDNFIYKKFSWPSAKLENNFVYWTDSEVKEEEIVSTKGARLYKILGPTGKWIASIITKD